MTFFLLGPCTQAKTLNTNAIAVINCNYSTVAFMYVSLSHAVLSKKIISYSPFILAPCSCIPSKWINFPLHLGNFGEDNGHLRREKLHVRIQCSSGYSIICIWWQSLFSFCNRNMWRENGFTSNSVPLSHIKKAHLTCCPFSWCSAAT